MKKLILPIITLLLFTTACSEQSSFEPQKCGFSCDAKVVYNETEFEAEIAVGENGVFSAEVTSPATIKGLKAEYGGEKVKLSYLGIETEILPEEIPYFNYVSALREILLSLENRLETTKSDNNFAYSGECSKGKYDILFRAVGFPIKIDLPSHDLTVTLENFQYVY